MVTRITLLRHGSVQKTFGDNRKHVLSDEGRRQACVCREKLSNPHFDCVLHSPLERTRETARIVAGLEEDEATTVIHPLFYDGTHPGAGTMDAAFRRLHHASLSAYYQLPNVRKHMEALALDAFELLNIEINCRNAKEVLVVGHCVLLLALCAVIVDDDEPFMSRVLGECEGYRIQMEKGERSRSIPSDYTPNPSSTTWTWGFFFYLTEKFIEFSEILLLFECSARHRGNKTRKCMNNTLSSFVTKVTT